MQRFLLLALALVALSGCGVSSDGQVTEPTVAPTVVPTGASTVVPTDAPTVVPTVVPTDAPTVVPTVVPTDAPPVAPTVVPSVAPTVVPTGASTVVPTTVVPTVMPTDAPTVVPTVAPTVAKAPATTSALSALSALPKAAQQGYITLITFKAIAMFMENPVRPELPPLDADMWQGLHRVIGAILTSASNYLDSEAPDPVLREAWGQARATREGLLNSYNHWVSTSATTADLSKELGPIHGQLDQVLDTAEGALVERYGGSTAAFRQLRQEMLQRYVDQLSTIPFQSSH